VSCCLAVFVRISVVWMIKKVLTSGKTVVQYWCKLLLISSLGSDSLRSGLKFYPCFFFNARSPRCVG